MYTFQLDPMMTATITAGTSAAEVAQLSPGSDPVRVASLAIGESVTIGPYGSTRCYRVESETAATIALASHDPLTPTVSAATARGESLSSQASDTIADGVNYTLGTTTGTKFGTAANQKLAFHGATPVVQRASADQAAVSLATVEDKQASISIGAPPNHLVVTADAAGTAGNAITVEAVLDAAPSQPLTAAIADGAITITLGTDGDGLADPAKNTATLAAAAVDALDGVSATAQGDGSSVIPTFSAANLSGGKAALTVAAENIAAQNTLLNEMRAALVEKGLIKGSA